MAKKSGAAGRRSVPTTRNRILLPALIAGVILLAAIAFAAVALYQGGNPATVQALPLEISPTEAAVQRNAGAFMLDVREPGEWTQFHVPGATLIPLGQLAERMNEVPQDREIVVMCRTGHRSAQARDILLKAGYPRVTSLAGGLTAWRAQGLSTVTGE